MNNNYFQLGDVEWIDQSWATNNLADGWSVFRLSGEARSLTNGWGDTISPSGNFEIRFFENDPFPFSDDNITLSDLGVGAWIEMYNPLGEEWEANLLGDKSGGGVLTNNRFRLIIMSS